MTLFKIAHKSLRIFGLLRYKNCHQITFKNRPIWSHWFAWHFKSAIPLLLNALAFRIRKTAGACILSSSEGSLAASSSGPVLRTGTGSDASGVEPDRTAGAPTGCRTRRSSRWSRGTAPWRMLIRNSGPRCSCFASSRVELEQLKNSLNFSTS